MIDLATAALGVVDKAMEMGLIKMKEKWKKEYFDKKNALMSEIRKEKKERDYGYIITLQDDLSLLLEVFEKEIENGRGV